MFNLPVFVGLDYHPNTIQVVLTCSLLKTITVLSPTLLDYTKRRRYNEPS